MEFYTHKPEGVNPVSVFLSIMLKKYAVFDGNAVTFYPH